MPIQRTSSFVGGAPSGEGGGRLCRYAALVSPIVGRVMTFSMKIVRMLSFKGERTRSLLLTVNHLLRVSRKFNTSQKIGKGRSVGQVENEGSKGDGIFQHLLMLVRMCPT